MGQTATAPDADLERLVTEGRVEQVEAQLRGSTQPDDLHLIARAWGHRARRARGADEQQRAWKTVDEKYLRWLEALEKPARGGDLPAVVRLAAGRVEYAGLLMAGRAGPQLDELEITAGQRGDRGKITAILTQARGLCEQAGAALEPIAADLPAREEELLAAGVYDLLTQSRLDGMLNLGWSLYFLGVFEADEVRRAELLGKAERKFQELVDSGQVGEMIYQCRLALGMAQRERGRLDEAARTMGYALAEGVPPAVGAQARYELARTQIRAGKFDEARATLRPLVDKDPEQLPEVERGAKFYINLAHLWDANSYLIEADAVRREAADTTARTAVLQKVQRCREAGVGRFRRLATRGGAWPALAQLYVAASVDLKAAPAELGTAELLYTAGVLIDGKKYREALPRLTEAARREEPDKQLAGEVLFELGRCQYLLKQERAAAETFGRLAREQRGHPQAPQAAGLAYGLWGQLAERSKKPEDYLALADTLRNLLESFPEHPKREEAAWLLPVALQLAGRYDAAAEEFGKVPATAKHGDEARYRRVMCLRRAVEAGRAGLSPDEYRARAIKAAEAMLKYADEAAASAAQAPRPEEVRNWAAEARLQAAELLASGGVDEYRRALSAVENFEAPRSGDEFLGRVLAARIRAYRGLRDFAAASQILTQYLRTAPAEQVGGTLGALARGMQDEVERLLAAGQAEAAAALAADALSTFEELEKWVQEDARRGTHLEAVQAGRARMLYLAGQTDGAGKLVDALLAKSPKNGNYQHLQALILTSRLTPESPTAEVERAQAAWEALLADGAIRVRAPERYWEARYHWLALALRLGAAADVETAITQERVWRPDLGGEPWRAKLEGLLREARAAQGKPTEPESQPSEAEQATPSNREAPANAARGSQREAPASAAVIPNGA